jgi:hypothetical protein
MRRGERGRPSDSWRDAGATNAVRQRHPGDSRHLDFDRGHDQVAAEGVYAGNPGSIPQLSSTSTPRFLLLGGQAYSLTPPGALSNVVYYNNAP